MSASRPAETEPRRCRLMDEAVGMYGGGSPAGSALHSVAGVVVACNSSVDRPQKASMAEARRST